MTQNSGKVLTCRALEGGLDTSLVVSSTFTMRWAGRLQEFPEIDSARLVVRPDRPHEADARADPFLDRLAEHLGRA